MDLERALEFLKTKVKTMIIQKLYNLLFQVSSLVARDLENYPPLPMPPSKLFNNPVAVKSYASKQLKWLLDPLKIKRGEGEFPGWDFKVDKAALTYTGGLLSNLPGHYVSMSMLIEWSEMANMSSLSSGNAKALKKNTGIKQWVPFVKILSEMIFVWLEEDPADWFKQSEDKKKPSEAAKTEKKLKKTGPKKRKTKNNPFVDTDSDFEEKENKKICKPQVKKTNVVTKLRKLAQCDGAEEHVDEQVGKYRILIIKNLFSRIFLQERERASRGLDNSLHLEVPSDVDRSAVLEEVFDIQTGRLSICNTNGEQELRVRGRRATEDLFSEFSSVNSTLREHFQETEDGDEDSREGHCQSAHLLRVEQAVHPVDQLAQLEEDLQLSEESNEEIEAKKVKVKNITITEGVDNHEKANAMNDVSRFQKKMKSAKVSKLKKPLVYLAPSSSSEDDDDEDDEDDDDEDDDEEDQDELPEVDVEENRGQGGGVGEEEEPEASREDLLKECRKAGIKCGIIKQVRETYSRFQTPINFQLIEKKPHEYGQWKVILSDGLWKHEFIMSNKYDYVMSKIRLNIILTLNEIYKMKSKKGQPNKKMQVLLITSFFVPTKQQVKYDIIGNPKTLML